MRGWWHRSRHVRCGICGTEFRKGRGSGMSGSVVCSDACWTEAWRQWWTQPTVAQTDAGERAGTAGVTRGEGE